MDFWTWSTKGQDEKRNWNIEIRRIMETSMEVIEKRRLEWFGYLCRTNDNPIHKMVNE